MIVEDQPLYDPNLLRPIDFGALASSQDVGRPPPTDFVTLLVTNETVFILQPYCRCHGRANMFFRNHAGL